MKLILLIIASTALALGAEDLHCIIDTELPHPGSILRGIRGRLDVSFTISGEAHPQSMSFKATGIPDILNSSPIDKEAEQRIMEREVRIFLESAEFSRTCAGETVHVHFVFGVLDNAPPRESWSGIFRFRPPNTFVFLTTQGMPEQLLDPRTPEIIRLEKEKKSIPPSPRKQ